MSLGAGGSRRQSFATTPWGINFRGPRSGPSAGFRITLSMKNEKDKIVFKEME